MDHKSIVLSNLKRGDNRKQETAILKVTTKLLYSPR